MILLHGCKAKAPSPVGFLMSQRQFNQNWLVMKKSNQKRKKQMSKSRGKKVVILPSQNNLLLLVDFCELPYLFGIFDCSKDK